MPDSQCHKSSSLPSKSKFLFIIRQRNTINVLITSLSSLQHDEDEHYESALDFEDDDDDLLHWFSIVVWLESAWFSSSLNSLSV